MWAADVNPDGVLPGCLCATRVALWWISASGLLYTWSAGPDPDEAVTDPTMVTQVDRFAEHLAVSQDGTRAVIASGACVSVYTIRYLESVCFLRMTDTGDEGDEDMLDTSRELLPTAQEVARVPCALGEVRHIALAPAAAYDSPTLVAAICTNTGLCVMGGLPEDTECSGDEHGVAVAHVDDSIYLTNFTCAELGATTVGSVLACFTGARQLLVVDEVNHLLLLLLNETTAAADDDDGGEGGTGATVELLVDGHICTRTARVTAVACGHSGLLGEAVIAVGFSNGMVHLLNANALHPLRRWSVQDAIGASLRDNYAANPDVGRRVRRLSRSSARARLGIPEPQETSAEPAAGGPMVVVDIGVGTHLISVATWRGVVHYSRQTLQPEVAYTHLFIPPLCQPSDSVQTSLAAVRMRLASNGRWTYTDYAEGVVNFSPHDVDSRHALATHAAAAATATNDVVHAQTPLPAAWLRQHDAASASTTTHVAGSKAAAPGQGSSGGGKVTAGAVAPRRAPAKGSGYGEAPWSVQQERKRRAKVTAARDRAAQASDAVSAAAANPVRFAYDFDRLFGLGGRGLAKMESATEALQRLHSRAVSEVVFSSAGDALLSAGADGRAQYLQFPVSRSKRTDTLVGRVMAGHAGGVTALDANLSRQKTLLVTGGADGYVRMWAPASHETPVVECAVGPGGGKDRRGVSAPVTTAQFFYLDKFALSCIGEALELRRCDLLGATSAGEELSATADLDAGALARACVYRYTVGEGHAITSATAVNHFTSNLVFLATSEKEVQVVDVAADTVLWREGGTHTRGIYRVATGRTSRYAGGTDVGSDAAHLFMSASLDSTAVLWDVRVAKPAQLFTQHVNTAIPSLALEFSPASAVVAVGSQDNAVYMYDLRGGRGAIALDVLRGLGAYPTSLAWHPLRPVLAVGLSDGSVHLLQQPP